jgi:Domain of unknown function (DUF4293)
LPAETTHDFFDMIQRIQTLFLLFASGALGGQFGLPYLQAGTETDRAIPALADGVLNPLDNIGILGLTVLSGVLALAGIFLFRNRALQTQIATLSMLCAILLTVLAGFTAYTLWQANPTAHWNAGLGLPALAAVLQGLAARYIRKDEALVRSMDRLR